MSEYFTASGSPSTSAQLSSAPMRAEFLALQSMSDKLPPLAGNANKAVVVNAGATGLAVTAGALALAVALTTAGAGAITLTSTGATNVTLPTTGTLATLAGAETLTNKIAITTQTLTATASVVTPLVGSTTDTNVNVQVNNLIKWQFLSVANNYAFVPGINNAQDIGVSPSALVRTGYFGTSVVTPLVVAPSNLILEAAGNNTVVLRANAVDVVFANTSAFRPAVDGAQFNGLAGARWAGVFTGNVDSGTGSLVLMGATTTAITITGANTVLAGTITINGTGTSLNVQASNAGGIQKAIIQNTNNTNAASHADLGSAVGGASSGDPYLSLTVGGVVQWTAGLDNSDSDKFKIGPSIEVGTNTALTLDSSGNAVLAGTIDGPASMTAFASALTALNIGHASAAAAFAGGISIPTGKNVTGAGTAQVTGFATVSATTLAGTLSTAAQPAITSTGTLVTDNLTAMGTGSGTAKTVGVAHVNTTAVGNVGAGPDDLMTYSLPANSLSANKKGIFAVMGGTSANNANLKTLTLSLGSDNFNFALTTNLFSFWTLTVRIYKTGSNAQFIVVELTEYQNTSNLVAPKMAKQTADITQTDTSSIILKAVATTVTSTNDIVQNEMLVWFLN